MSNIAIIPARGGSKRLPEKNRRPLAGKPLIEWSISAALESNCFDQVIVSTDDKIIADISEAAGAIIPGLRAAEFSTDTTAMSETILHTLEQFTTCSQLSTVTILQPTSPLRTKSDISRAFDIYNSLTCDAVISVTELEHPIEWTGTMDDNLSMHGFLQKELRRSQDYQRRYRLNGAIYLLNASCVSDFGPKIYRKNIRGVAIPNERSVDIDTLIDFQIAEFLMKQQLKRENDA